MGRVVRAFEALAREPRAFVRRHCVELLLGFDGVLALAIPVMAISPYREEGARRGAIPAIDLEDQDGNTLRSGTFFSGKPAIVVFFYTRCSNPNKCSLTITNLARLQKAIVEERLEGRISTAAITYDPEYDFPARLKAYGENRGVLLSDNHRIFRTRTGFHELQDFFQLGVNFTGSTVNRHRLELFILDSQGQLAVTFSRLQWDNHAVLEQAKILSMPKG